MLNDMKHVSAINKSNITTFVYTAQFDWLAVVLFDVNLSFYKRTNFCRVPLTSQRLPGAGTW